MIGPASTNDKLAGLVLVAAGALSVFAMGHHPSGAAAHSSLANVVHGVMMVVVVTIFAGLTHFSIRRGLDRFLVLAALIFYGAAVVGNLFAAAINGFAVVGFGRGGGSDEVLAFAWELNQALAYAAVYATSVAFVLWGLDLLRGPRAARWLGVSALVGGLASAATLATGMVQMNVAGAFVVYAVQAGFAALVGLYLIRGQR